MTMRTRCKDDEPCIAEGDTPELRYRIVDGVVEVWEPKPQPSRGLGDTIAKATKAVGVKPCGGCEKRRRILNKFVPYK